MSCVNAVNDAVLSYIRINRHGSFAGPVLSFLYQTHTIQRRRFHGDVRKAEEEQSSTTPRPLVRYTSLEDKSHDQDQRQKPRYERERNFNGARNPRDVGSRGNEWPRSSFTQERPRTAQRDFYERNDRPQGKNWSSPPSDTYEEDNLPFDDAEEDAEPRLRLDNSSTMTDLERNAFARLFGSLAGKHSKSSHLEQEEEGNDDDAMPSFGQEIDELERQDRQENDMESILDQQLQNEAPNLEKYPAVLRGMAAKAQLQVARDKILKDRGMQETGATKNEAAVAAEKEIKRLWVKMSFAGSDTEVWNVLEQEVFAKVRVMDLDEVFGNKKKKKAADAPETDATTHGESSSAQSNTNSTPTPSPPTTDLAIFARVYPHILNRALRLLTTRLPHTPLIPTLLPTLKSLGTSSYILGISTPLYNTLLSHTWRFPNDLRSMLTLLREMNDAGLTLDMETWRVLEKVTLYRYRALRGDFGEGARVAEGMSERMREGKEVFEWKREIRRRVEEEALERVRESDVRRRLEREDEEELLGEEGRVATDFPAVTAAA